MVENQYSGTRYSAAVVGASGYAGGEVLRLLSGHPALSVDVVTAHRKVGEPVTASHPHLAHLRDVTFTEADPQRLAACDVVFLALPHGASGGLIEQIRAAGSDTLVVDCGADHRLTSAEDWDAFYGGAYHGHFPYGMPELVLAGGGTQREHLVGVSEIAVPGCNVSAVTLGVAPLVRAGLLDAAHLTAVLPVGPSGAGKKAAEHLLASELLGSAAAYAVGGTHRHIPEILQNLRVAGAADPRLGFTPVLVPMARGILAVINAPVGGDADAAALHTALADAYDDEPFLHVLPLGSVPATKSVLGSNSCAIGVAVDERTGLATVVSALDNLGKGTAGAAIQSAHLALGLPETLHLPVNGVAP